MKSGSLFHSIEPISCLMHSVNVPLQEVQARSHTRSSLVVLFHMTNQYISGQPESSGQSFTASLPAKAKNKFPREPLPGKTSQEPARKPVSPIAIKALQMA